MSRRTTAISSHPDHLPQTLWRTARTALHADAERGRYSVWNHSDFFPGLSILLATLAYEDAHPRLIPVEPMVPAGRNPYRLPNKTRGHDSPRELWIKCSVSMLIVSLLSLLYRLVPLKPRTTSTSKRWCNERMVIPPHCTEFVPHLQIHP